MILGAKKVTHMRHHRIPLNDYIHTHTWISLIRDVDVNVSMVHLF